MRKGENGQMNVDSGEERKKDFEYFCIYRFYLTKQSFILSVYELCA